MNRSHHVRHLLAPALLAALRAWAAPPPGRPPHPRTWTLLSGRSRQRMATAACRLADGSILLASQWRRRTNLRRVSVHQCRRSGSGWRCGPPADLPLPGTFWTQDHPVLACGPGGTALLAVRLRTLRPGRARIEMFRVQGCRGRCRPRTAPWTVFRPPVGDWAPGSAWLQDGKLMLSAGRVGRAEPPGCMLLACSAGGCRRVSGGPAEAAECSMAELSDGTVLAVFRNKDARRKWCEWAWKKPADRTWHRARQGLGACHPALLRAKGGHSAIQALSERRAGRWKVLVARLELTASGGRVRWGGCSVAATEHRILAPILLATGHGVVVIYAFEARAFRFQTNAAHCPWANRFLEGRLLGP